MIIVVVPLFLLILILIIWQLSNLISIYYGSPYVMADKKVIRAALELAKIKKGEKFYDLGCGRGDALIEAAKRGAKCIGYEISPYYYIYAKLKTLKYRKIKIQYRNINQVDLSKADIVYCYLLPKFLKKLALKFKKEMPKGSRLISMGFPIPGLSNEKKYNIENRKIFIYKVK